ncbi:hypothetical protein IC582_003789 [Cucumis melo]
MIHESDLVCWQSTRMDRQTFAIPCHLLRNVAGLSSTEIVDVEEMVDSWILRDAISRENGLQVPKEGFLAPYRGQRYHLQEWRGVANAPTNANEYFNMKHSSARNVIERAFGVLKGPWVILRGNSYYPLQVQCRTILACALLHNLINREMTYCDDVDDEDEGDSTYAMTTASEDIQYIETTNEWS